MFRGFLSWRYLVSRPTNLIGIVGILVAVGALILILSIMTGFLEESRRTVRGTLSDVLIEPVQGESGVPREPGPLLAAVRADPRVAAASAELGWLGLIMQREQGAYFERLFASQTLGDRLVVQLVGVDVHGAARVALPVLRAAVGLLGGLAPPVRVQDELDATAFLRSLVGDEDEPGRWTAVPANPLFPFAPPERRSSGRPKAGILVGEQLLDDLGLRRGQVLEIATPVWDPASRDWKQNNREFVVSGTFRTRDNETDRRRVYLERPELAVFLGHTREYTQVLARLRDYERDSRAVVEDLRVSLAEQGLIVGGALYRDGAVEVRTWEEFQGNLLGAIENERVLMGIMLSLVLVVAGFTIFAILSMMATEKRRDIGILSALGATPRGILQLFLMIAFWDAFVGGVLGAVLGTWGAIKIDPIERWLSATFGVQIFNREVYLFDHIPSIVQPLWVGAIVLGAFVCALVFAALPAWRAARLDPLQALRYE